MILKTSLDRCSDFRRMARLSAGLTRAKASASQRAAILLDDRCWRNARISRKLLEEFSAAKGVVKGCDRALHAVVVVKKTYLAKRLNHHAYWSGPVAIIAHSQVKYMNPVDVECIAARVGKAAGAGDLDIDATVLHMVSKMQFVDWYSAVSCLRVCQALMGFKFIGNQDMIFAMTEHVDTFSRLLPYMAWKSALFKAGVRITRRLCNCLYVEMEPK